MAKRATGKSSRQQRRKQRRKAERARAHGLPSPSAAVMPARVSARRDVALRRRLERGWTTGESAPDQDANAPESMPSAAESGRIAAAPWAPSSWLDRLRGLPRVAQVALVATLVLTAVWALAQWRDASRSTKSETSRPERPAPSDSSPAASHSRPQREQQAEDPQQAPGAVPSAPTGSSEVEADRPAYTKQATDAPQGKQRKPGPPSRPPRAAGLSRAQPAAAGPPPQQLVPPAVDTGAEAPAPALAPRGVVPERPAVAIPTAPRPPSPPAPGAQSPPVASGSPY